MIIRKLKSIYKRYVLKMTSEDIDLEELIERGLKVGQNSHIYSSAGIDHIYPHLITIGERVTMSTNITILAHDASTDVVGCGTKLGRVNIGNNVFVGTGTTILCNVNIGNNVVIGAQSLVTCDLPDNGVYAGVPARRLCSIEEYRNKNIKLRETRPDFSAIKPWYQWNEATEDEKQQMIDGLEDGIGFI